MNTTREQREELRRRIDGGLELAEIAGSNSPVYSIPLDQLSALLDDIEEAEREEEKLRSENDLLTHKVITCGVAASHPDPALSERPRDYGGKWDSPQAQQVRALRKDRDRLREGLQSRLSRYRQELDRYQKLGRITAIPEIEGEIATLERLLNDGGGHGDE